jgi:hypothetical protein
MREAGDPFDQDDTGIVECAECGHDHFVFLSRLYLPCPLAEEGCDCPFKEGD